MPRLTKSQAKSLQPVEASTDTLVSVKASRKASRKASQPQPGLSAVDIATIVAQTVASELDRRDKLATRIPGQPTPVVNNPISAELMALVDSGVIDLATAQATANNPAIRREQQSAVDHIPQPMTYAPPTPTHRQAGIAYGKDKQTGKQYHFFGFPLVSKVATGNDFNDRDALGYHACKSLLDEDTRRQMQTYVEFCESEQRAAGKYRVK